MKGGSMLTGRSPIMGDQSGIAGFFR